MIPHKLQLKNFLSYGSTLETIDFSPYSLICLSGKNGHGKSALLDAMTWALWGQARKASGATKADQSLLRLGQTQMLVIFDFECNGTPYRIRREYMETYGKPIATLEFGILDQTTNTLIPLTDKTIRATQAKIEQTLRIDFDSFCNSAFLRQGNSNEFSKKSPKDRKQILAAILGLDQYEVIRKLALEKIKDAAIKKNVLSLLQAKREQELSTQEELTRELIQINQEMTTIDTQEKELKTAQHALENEKKIVNEKQKEYERNLYQWQQHKEQEQSHKETLKNLVHQWRSINKQKKSLHDITHLEQEKKKLHQAIEHHQTLFQQNLEKKEALLNLAQEIARIEQEYKDSYAQKQQTALIELERLITTHKNNKNNARILEQQCNNAEKELHDITTQINSYDETITHETAASPEIATLKTQEAHLEKRKAAYHHFVSLGNVMSTELKNSIQKKNLIHEDNPSCPLCEQNLSASRKRFLKNNFEKTELFLTHRLNRLKHIIPQLKEILIKQHEQITHTKEKIHTIASLTEKSNELKEMRQKIEAVKREIENTRDTCYQQLDAEEKKIILQQNALDQLQQEDALKSHTIYQQLVQKRELFTKDIAQHSYNPHEYQKARDQLMHLEQQLQSYTSFQKELENQQSRMHNIQLLCATLKQLTKEIIAREKTLSTHKNILNAQQECIEKEQMLEQEYTRIKQHKEQLLTVKGSKEHQQKHLNRIAHEYEQEKKNIAALDITIDDYQTIATATGKDGIQALLIEDTIPEIEQEANYLLSRLTNNQAHIFIESLRDLKKGGTKETLDINISDQVGIRPYELFSGGEAFRIDFALRIAISKLLARRAGTALQTLIIDEGFGSQDEEGLGYIMDALHTIQEDFSKIIIVSHLPIMKDQFPVHFFVEKKVQGSMVHVIEQG